jgi:DNA polymerase
MNIVNKVEDYLKFQSEVFGDEIHIVDVEPTPLPPFEGKAPLFEHNVVENSNPCPIETQEENNTEIENMTVQIETQPEVIDKVETKMPIINSNPEVKSSIAKDWKESESLEILNSKISSCLECELGNTRNKFVFGDGNPNADIMVIGEAPGADEDEQGLPFVGRAGQLLTKMLEAIYFKREDIYIANICKCRPPGNRRPTPTEVDSCEPYLKKQIELIKPVFILSLGLTSVDTLLKKKHKMGDIRGNIMDYHGINMLVTYHPAALLRNPQWKKDAWEDLKKLRILYDKYLLTKK